MRMKPFFESSLLRKWTKLMLCPSTKAVLAGVLLLGFVMTLPAWFGSTPEGQQRLTFLTTAEQSLEPSTGALAMTPTERKRLASTISSATDAKEKAGYNVEEIVWAHDIQQMIAEHVRKQEDLEAIAHWVYFYSQHFELKPELVLSVMMVESHFDRLALSPVGARGLMQVMPFWKKELGSKQDNLFDIETNIRYGCAILKHYVNRYGSLNRALAAYNGSLGRMRYPRKVYRQMQKFQQGTTNV